MSFRKLLDMSNKIALDELDDYVICHRSRADNMINNLESQVKIIEQLRIENEDLKAQLTALEFKINNGIRVVAYLDDDGLVRTSPFSNKRNATVLFDEKPH